MQETYFCWSPASKERAPVAESFKLNVQFRAPNRLDDFEVFDNCCQIARDNLDTQQHRRRLCTGQLEWEKMSAAGFSLRTTDL